MTVVAALLAGIIGILAGWLINLFADYLPSSHAIAQPKEISASDDKTGENTPTPTFYPTYPDGTRRSPIAWLGLLAWLTGKNISPTGSKIPRRHAVVELTLGVTYAWLVFARPWSLNLAFQLLFLAILLLIAVIDIEHKLILFVVILPSCVLALLAAWLVPFPPPSIRDAILGALLGFVVFFVMFLGGVLFSTIIRTDEVAFGFGDVLLGILSGMILGYQAFIYALFLTIFLGALGALLYLISRALLRNKYTMFTALPYGPYIVLSTVIMMLWRSQLAQFLSGQ